MPTEKVIYRQIMIEDEATQTVSRYRLRFKVNRKTLQ
jgi:hypothetical protein